MARATRSRGEKTGRTWFLVFQGDFPERPPHWWDFWTTPDFRHCWGYTQLTDEGVLTLDKGYNSLEIELEYPFSPAVYLSLLRVMPFTTAILKVSRPPDPGTLYHGAFYYCVPQIKALIGLRSWAVTPYQLYRQLLRMDGVEIIYKKRGLQHGRWWKKT